MWRFGVDLEIWKFGDSEIFKFGDRQIFSKSPNLEISKFTCHVFRVMRHQLLIPPATLQEAQPPDGNARRRAAS
jgi:hypothetical protein